jgi:hypothetical protein
VFGWAVDFSLFFLDVNREQMRVNICVCWI